MSKAIRELTKEQIAEMGDEIYDTKVQPRLTKKDFDRFVAIDIDTGEWELGNDEMEAYDRLHARLPNAQTWLVRAGRGYLHSFGGRDLRSPPE